MEHERTRRDGRGWLIPLVVLGTATGMYASACTDPTGTGDGVRAEASAEVEAEPPVVFDEERIRTAQAILRRQIELGSFPGAALAVGVRGQRVHLSGMGRVGWSDGADFVDPERTLYDLASLTKAVGTTTAVMLLVEDGRMGLDDRVSKWVPEFAGGRETGVTVRQLLTHTAGVRAGAEDFNMDAPTSAVRRYVVTRPLTLEPGESVLYSDIGFVVLWTAAERAAGEPLERLLQRRVWGPLGMRDTRFSPPRGCTRCAPTLRLSTGEPYAGGSYDELGRAMDGRAGNAGLFSTAADLGRFAAMIASGGRLDGVRVLREETLRTFLAPQPGAGSFALGWVTYCREGKVKDHVACKDVYGIGHTGFTGTALWIDPRSGTWMVLLTNRVYEPRRDIDMTLVRRRVYARLTGQADAE